eukprot:TRINITY_DN5360_c0_g1_i2.p1 TRINITY_DN5360_c0_g1~~TRINITY_DN5360_c0_g1_i2.p1  ORF type:complete len:139 (+),score=34.36 TRINITY_DN5360_c0_g1_i2:294-710(+)
MAVESFMLQGDHLHCNYSPRGGVSQGVCEVCNATSAEKRATEEQAFPDGPFLSPACSCYGGDCHNPHHTNKQTCLSWCAQLNATFYVPPPTGSASVCDFKPHDNNDNDGTCTSCGDISPCYADDFPWPKGDTCTCTAN